MKKSKRTIATPPGETIKEIMLAKGMSQKQLALRMDMSEKHVSKLVNGNIQLTPNVAIRLESVLGMTASFWQNLESIYREKLERVKVENELDEDIDLSKKFPYSDMAGNGWIEEENNEARRVMNLRRFFEVAKLTVLSHKTFPRVACRQLATTERTHYSLMAWVQKARLLTRDAFPGVFDKQELRRSLPRIRKMTMELPKDFFPELYDLLLSCGIVLVILPHIKGSYLQGVTFREKNKVVIGLTVRRKDADIFWFSFFHEIGHILYDHIDKCGELTDDDETTADIFARNALIPPEQYSAFVQKGRFDSEDIIRFGRKIGIDAGVVVGRLQNDGHIEHNKGNDLKKKYILK